MDEQKKDKQRTPFLRFMDRYGFAVFLGLGVALVAGIGWAASQLSPEEIAASPTPIVQETQQAAISPSVTNSDNAVADNGDATTTFFEAPVDGEVGMTFSVDKPVFNETLEQWETHKGIDILADEGTEVRAVMAGDVIAAQKDDYLGNCITVEHADGTQAVYGSLSTLSLVKVGKQVKANELIGAVGVSAPAEFNQGAHLHFEFWKDGQPVDPAQYIKN